MRVRRLGDSRSHMLQSAIRKGTLDMAEANQELRIDLGLNGGSFECPTTETADEFLQTEKSKWGWLLEKQPDDNVGRAMAQHYREQFGELERILRDGNGNNEDRLKRFRSEVTDRYRRAVLIHSSSSTAEFVRCFHEQDPTMAFFALRWAVERGDDSPPRNRAEFAAALKTELFRTGVLQTAQAEAAALNDVFRKFDTLRAECRSALTEISDEQSRFGKKNQQFADEWQTATKTRADDFRTQLGEFARQHQEQTGSHDERLTQMEATFKERLSLEAPVKFWNDRRWWHNLSAVVYGVAAILVGGSGFCWLFKSATDAVASMTLDKPSYFKLIPLMILALGVFWVLRILVRLLLSHIHLASDAAERVVMVNTYLALLQSNEAATKEDRQLILQQLFRHAATGVVADDSAPPLPQTEILKVFTGK